MPSPGHNEARMRLDSLTITCLCGCGRSETLSGDGVTLTMDPVFAEPTVYMGEDGVAQFDIEANPEDMFKHYVVDAPIVAPHGGEPIKVRGVRNDGYVFAFPWLSWEKDAWISHPDRNGHHFAMREKR